MRINIRTLLTISALGCLGTISRVQAQSALDVSPCFNELLQQKLDYTSTEDLRLATLAQISEKTYDAFRRDGKLSAQYGILSGSASYADFSDKRRQYFSQHKLDLSYYQAISTSSRTLGREAYAVITDCIGKVASHADGFHWLYTIDDPTAASVQFFWRSPVNAPAVEQVRVVDSVLDNAQVVNGQSHPGHLFEVPAWWQPSPRIGLATPVILLRRVDKSSVIRIAITTDPQLNTGFITIPSVPPAVPEPVMKYTHQDTQESVPFDKKAGTFIGRGTPDCSDCAVFRYEREVAGEVVGVTCTFGPGTHNNTRYCGPDGPNKAVWEYYTNDGNFQSMVMSVTYRRRVAECTAHCENLTAMR
jgi:hypothetical protein